MSEEEASLMLWVDISDQSSNPTLQSAALSTGTDQYQDEATCPSGTPLCLVCSVETVLGRTSIPLCLTLFIWSQDQTIVRKDATATDRG